MTQGPVAGWRTHTKEDSSGDANIVHFLFPLSTMMRLLPLAVAVAGLLQYVQAGTYDHRYKKGEHVELWVSKVRGMNHFIVMIGSFS